MINQKKYVDIVVRCGFLVLVVLVLTSCSTPWYSLYGIESEQELYSASSVPAIIEALHSEKPQIRRMAAATLNTLGAEASPAVDALSVACVDEDVNVRKHALQAMKTIVLENENVADEALVPIINGLEDGSGNNRIHVVDYLYQIAQRYPSRKDRIIIPLKKALMDENQNISLRALKRVNILDPGTDEALTCFKRLFSSNNASVRRYAVVELKESLYPREEIFSFLDHLASHDPRATVRRDALIFLRWGDSERNSNTKPPYDYTTVKESVHGYVTFRVEYPEGKIPLPISVKKVIDGYPMPVEMKMEDPVVNRPGKHLYQIAFQKGGGEYRLDHKTEKKYVEHIPIFVEKNKNTACVILIHLKNTVKFTEGQYEKTTYFYDKEVLTGQPE